MKERHKILFNVSSQLFQLFYSSLVVNIIFITTCLWHKWVKILVSTADTFQANVEQRMTRFLHATTHTHTAPLANVIKPQNLEGNSNQKLQFHITPPIKNILQSQTMQQPFDIYAATRKVIQKIVSYSYGLNNFIKHKKVNSPPIMTVIHPVLAMYNYRLVTTFGT